MIPITINNTKILDEYKLRLQNFLDKRRTYSENTINVILKKYFPFINCGIMDLSIASYSELLKLCNDYNAFLKNPLNNITAYKDYIKKTPNIGINIGKTILKVFVDLYNEFIGSDNNGETNGLWLMKTLNIKVCPYCNRNYIYNTSKKSKGVRTSQFDHFFPKSKYPFLALSFFNLVPSCSTCNHLKLNSESDIISPYDSQLTNDTFRFKVLPKNNNEMEIILVSQNPNYIKNQISMNIDLGLKDLYEYHSYIADDLYLKSKIYTKGELQALYKRLSKFYKFRPDLKSRFKRLILGNYGNNADFTKYTLSKVTKDVAEFMKIIKTLDNL